MLKARQRNTDLAGNSDGSGSRLSLNFLRSTHLVTLRSRDSKFYHNMSMHIMVVDKGWVHSGITGTITILYAFTHFPRHYLRYVVCTSLAETLIICTGNEIHIGIIGIYYTYYKVFTAERLVYS